jgi:hypothetical protein
MTFRLLPLAAVGAALALAVPAFAANGITVVSPKSGAKVKSGTRPTFKVKVSGDGTVWVHVCKSKKKDSEGVICSDELIHQMKKKGSTASVKAPFFDYPDFWLNSPGTYYWQAYRISCEGSDTSDCKQEGPITKFKVS